MANNSRKIYPNMAKLHVNNHYTQALSNKLAQQLDPHTFEELSRFLQGATRKMDEKDQKIRRSNIPYMR